MISDQVDLLERSKKLRKEGLLVESLKYCQMAIARGKSSEASDLLKELIAEISKEETAESLLAQLSTDYTNKSKKIEKASKLYSISQQKSTGVSLIPQIDAIVDLILKTDGDLGLLLTQILVNISQFPESLDNLKPKAIDIISRISKKHENNSSWKYNILTNLINNACLSKNIDISQIETLLKFLFENCRNEDLMSKDSHPANSSLLKILGNDTISNYFVKKELDIVIRLLENRKAPTDSLAVALLSLIIKNMNQQNLVNSIYSSIKLMNIKSNFSYLLVLSSVIQADINIGYQLLSKDGFLNSIIEDTMINTDSFRFDAMQVIYNASSHPEFSKIITPSCNTFILSCLKNHNDQKLKFMASSALIKLVIQSPDTQNEILNSDESFQTFCQIIEESDDLNLKSQALESLSYLSIKQKFKDLIINQKNLFSAIKSMVLKKGELASQYAFALLCLNLVQRPKQLSDEEVQLKKLHQMAKSIPNSEPVEDIKKIDIRIEKLVSLNLVPILVSLENHSSNIESVLAEILLSVSTNQKFRGELIKAGAVKRLLKHTQSSELNESAKLNSAQTLAKIAITSDPTIAFKGELIIEVVKPLVFLLKSDNSLGQFESLMALTNLASVNDRLRERIINLEGFILSKDMLFSSNNLIRRASVELICNLMYHPTVFFKFLENDSQILKIMVALSNDEDFQTQRAASGILAILSSESDSIPQLLKQKSFEETLVNLLKSRNQELLARAFEIVKNLNQANKLSPFIFSALEDLENK